MNNNNNNNLCVPTNQASLASRYAASFSVASAIRSICFQLGRTSRGATPLCSQKHPVSIGLPSPSACASITRCLAQRCQRHKASGNLLSHCVSKDSPPRLCAFALPSKDIKRAPMCCFFRLVFGCRYVRVHTFCVHAGGESVGGRVACDCTGDTWAEWEPLS